MHLKAVSVPRILIAVHRCRHFIYTIITPKNNCARKYWNIYFPVFPSCELLKWAALGNSQSEQSRTVKQPIRAEPHCETANQSRATLWNSQSEQSYTVKQPIRAELHCETANQSRAALWNSQSEQSRTVKQPIRAELHCETANQQSHTVKQPIRAEPHCETANQSRATLWNSQSEQSSTSLFMTLPNKPITDLFILGRNTRVVNAHVKPFLDHFCPYRSHIPSIDIREQIKILYQCIIYSSHILIFHFKICTYQTCTHIIVYIIYCVILLFCTLPIFIFFYY